MRIARDVLFLPCILVVGAACNSQDYVGDPTVYALAMDENTPALVEGDEGAIFVVERRIELPIVRPSQEDLDRLGRSQPPPYPRTPWVARGDLPMRIDWALTNLSDQPVEMTVILNGINEFHEYQPTYDIVDDEVVPSYSQWERTYALDPFETREGTIREEEMDEVAVDLATVVNGAPNSNLVVYFENQSDHDPRSEELIPNLIPGLVGFRVGLQSTAAVPVVLEATILARNEGERLADPETDTVWDLPMPQIFNPVVPMVDE